MKKAILKRKISLCGGYKDFPHRGFIGSQMENSTLRLIYELE
ncbi:hypothetical protein GGQ57_000906 [Parabacteroides faecis]|uniref:Uncharacterized protein n=1 Tax=Parabacteroides faecis TaxID=1217282 RepID=A0ABR6KJB8_9BACT|nr:hypothetical protein [Parabacteroides faecis]